MKKIWILPLLAALTLGLAACDDTAEPQDTAINQAEAETEDTSDDILSVEAEASSEDDGFADVPEDIIEETSDEAADMDADSYTATGEDDLEGVEYVHYEFRNDKLLDQHYEKHGIEMGFESAEAYEEAACEVINNPDALYKEEAEDGDGVYYVVDTNEFAILSTDGYIRTYFEPSAGLAYFERQ